MSVLLCVWQPDVGGPGPDGADAPRRGGALHPALHPEHLEEQLPAGGAGGGAPPAGLLGLGAGRPEHHGPVPEQGHRAAAAAPAPHRQEDGEHRAAAAAAHLQRYHDTHLY